IFPRLGRARAARVPADGLSAPRRLVTRAHVRDRWPGELGPRPRVLPASRDLLRPARDGFSGRLRRAKFAHRAASRRTVSRGPHAAQVRPAPGARMARLRAAAGLPGLTAVATERSLPDTRHCSFLERRNQDRVLSVRKIAETQR